MQSTPTFDLILRQVKQMSLTDQFRLLEWLISQLKATMMPSSIRPLSIAELEQQHSAGYQRTPQQFDETMIWLDEQVWEE